VARGTSASAQAATAGAPSTWNATSASCVAYS